MVTNPKPPVTDLARPSGQLFDGQIKKETVIVEEKVLRDSKTGEEFDKI